MKFLVRCRRKCQAAQRDTPCTDRAQGAQPGLPSFPFEKAMQTARQLIPAKTGQPPVLFSVQREIQSAFSIEHFKRALADLDVEPR